MFCLTVFDPYLEWQQILKKDATNQNLDDFLSRNVKKLESTAAASALSSGSPASKEIYRYLPLMADLKPSDMMKLRSLATALSARAALFDDNFDNLSINMSLNSAALSICAFAVYAISREEESSKQAKPTEILVIRTRTALFALMDALNSNQTVVNSNFHPQTGVYDMWVPNATFALVEHGLKIWATVMVQMASDSEGSYSSIRDNFLENLRDFEAMYGNYEEEDSTSPLRRYAEFFFGMIDSI